MKKSRNETEGLVKSGSKTTTKFTQNKTHEKRTKKKSKRKSTGSLWTYLLPERRKYVPLGALFLSFCCIVYFKFSHIRLESVWDNVPKISDDASNFENFNSNPSNAQDSYIHNLQKIELGIDVNEPVSMNKIQYEFKPENYRSQTGELQRPYSHNFDWYTDYNEHLPLPPQVYSYDINMTIIVRR